MKFADESFAFDEDCPWAEDSLERDEQSLHEHFEGLVESFPSFFAGLAEGVEADFEDELLLVSDDDFDDVEFTSSTLSAILSPFP